MNLRWYNGELQQETATGWEAVPTVIDPVAKAPWMCDGCGAFIFDKDHHTCWVKIANETT